MPLLFALTLPLSAAEPVVLDGDVPSDGAFFQLPFDVPAGAAEIAVTHAAGDGADILDWGVIDPTGALRGWGGGNTEDAVFGEDSASRSYLPGALPSGEWAVLVGKARVRSAAPTYAVTVTVRDAPTLAAQPERRPYVDVDLGGGPRWVAGDFHVHSRESGDASPSLDAVAAFARAKGLDFVALSEHNTTSHLTLLGDAQDRSPDVLLVPGAEITTYGGHANGLGLTLPVPFALGLDGLDFLDVAAAVADAGALLSINHPVLDLGDACIGCAWDNPVPPPEHLAAVEIATGGWEQSGQLFDEAAIAFWDALLDDGYHLAAIGGSDDHTAGTGTGAFHSDIGDPTTLVYVDTLSRPALLDGIRAGRTVVKLQGPDDPMVVLDAEPAADGDTVRASEVRFTAEVTDGVGTRVRFVVDGVPREPVGIDADPFVATLVLTPAEAGRVRAEVMVEGYPRTVTSHLWLAEGAAIEAPPPACGCASAPRPVGLVALSHAGLALARRRSRRVGGGP